MEVIILKWCLTLAISSITNCTNNVFKCKSGFVKNIFPLTAAYFIFRFLPHAAFANVFLPPIVVCEIKPSILSWSRIRAPPFPQPVIFTHTHPGPGRLQSTFTPTILIQLHSLTYLHCTSAHQSAIKWQKQKQNKGVGTLKVAPHISFLFHFQTPWLPNSRSS